MGMVELVFCRIKIKEGVHTGEENASVNALFFNSY